MPEHIVIVGAGQAGLQAVITLRAEGFAGQITLVGDEPFAPYQRPPLSKAYLLGKMERPRLFLKPDSYFEQACTLKSGVAAYAIDRAARRLTLADGSVLGYDALLLATGTRARPLDVPGADLDGVHLLRSIADVDALRPEIVAGRKCVIVGGGYIGLEVAAVAASHGLDVTLIEFQDRVLARSVSTNVSAYFEAAHRAHGVKLVCGAAVEAFEGEGRLSAVRAGGVVYPADFVLVGVGALANIELAKAAGLTCQSGIVVNEYATTSDPAIWAAGDCTWHQGYDGVWRRLESVQNAIDQAKCAARAMLGKRLPYRELPWFWSDQYDLKLQIVGLARDADQEILRGDPASGKFGWYYLRDGALVSAVTVNLPADHLMARKLIAAGVRSPADALADPTQPLKAFLPAA